MSLLVSTEDLIKQIFLSSWVVNHDGIMESDLGIRKTSSDLWSLIKASFYELYNLRDSNL